MKTQKNQKTICGQILLALMVLVAFSGCFAGRKIVVGMPGTVDLSYIALLPQEYPADVRSERVDRTRELVVSELRNHGVLVVEDRVVNSVCSEPRCPEQKEFFSKYRVDAVGDLKFDSVSGGDFVLGRYSTISGALELRDQTGKVVLNVQHSTRQAGGLLLNTGAVAQAVKTLADSFQDSTFEPLAQKFSRELLAGIRFVGNDATRASSEDLQIAGITLSEMPGKGAVRRKKVCVQATPSNLLTIRSKSLVADLVELTPGNYCGIYPARDIASFDKYSAQLRTASGLSVTKDLLVANQAKPL